MIFKNLLHKIAQKKSYGFIQQRLGKLYMIDASVISLCLSRYPWAVFRKSKAGIKMHLRLSFDGTAVPDEVIVTPAKTADKNKLDELIVEDDDALNIFDRGYVDYKKFDECCQNGIRFVTRLKDNAAIEFIGERPVKEQKDPGNSEVYSHTMILQLLPTSLPLFFRLFLPVLRTQT